MTEPTPSASPPQKKFRIRWQRVGIVCIVLLILAEVGLRILGFGNPVLTVKDAACGYRVAPDQHAYRLFAHNDINHYGMRSPEIQPQRPKGTLRFFFIGDSVTYGTTYVDQSEIFTSRLARLLPVVEHQPVEVLNQSAGGWSPPNEVHYFLDQGAFDSNAVIFVLNTGDPYDGFAPFPEGNLNYPTVKPVTAIGEVITRYLIPRIRGKIFPDTGTTLPDPAAGKTAFAANCALLLQARDAARRAHAVFAIAYVPFAGWPKDQIESAEQALQKWTAANDVVYIDTAPALAMVDPKLTTVDGLHPRSRGDEIIAESIASQWSKIDAAMKGEPADTQAAAAK